MVCTFASELARARLATREGDAGARLVAETPLGALFVPGTSTAPCAGPDASGACSHACALVERPCAGATWHHRNARLGWDFVFRTGSRACPVTLLEKEPRPC